MVTFDPELSRKVDIVEEQIDFSSARKQFQQANSEKRGPAPQIYSAKPFARARGGSGGDGEAPESGDCHVTWSDEGLGEEFTCARAVMTMVREEEEEAAVGSGGRSPAHPEESDSGLDELSVRSQDTAPFSTESVSDSGASLPPTPQPLTPVDGRTNGGPTEEELEFHAGVLVQNALRSALAAEGGGEAPWPPTHSGSLDLSHPPCSPSSSSSSSSLDSSGAAPPRRGSEVGGASQEAAQSPHQSPPPSLPPSQPTSPPSQQQQQRPRNAGPRIKIQSSYARALASSAAAPPPAAPPTVTAAPRPVPVYRPPSPPSPDKPEFSYFSKYSEAAELRSTAAVAPAPEAEPASGPFRLRSKKQRTLSMIEEEIRAAQQREEELKKQRETLPPQVVVRGSGHSPGRAGQRPPTSVTAADKMKSNSLPTKLTLTARTAPGRRTAPISSWGSTAFARKMKAIFLLFAAQCSCDLQAFSL